VLTALALALWAATLLWAMTVDQQPGNHAHLGHPHQWRPTITPTRRTHRRTS
jgi:hypothetical protein